MATTSDNVIADVDCSAAATRPTTDIEAFNAGWVASTSAPSTPAPTTTSAG
jgi:hypothetical protein